MSEPATPVTLSHIARLAGVSKMTASNVINNKSGMSEATRQRVLSAIEQCGYVVNPAARVLAGRRMNLIGVMAPSVGVPYVAELLQGANQAAEEAGMSIAVLTTSGNSALDYDRTALLRTMADGVLLILPRGGDQRLLEAVVPVVTVGGTSTYSALGDNRQGGRQAAQHLLGLGHRRVAYIRGDHDVPFLSQESAEREQGFVEVFRAAGLDVSADHLREGNAEESGGEAAATALLRLPLPPTAIFTFNDLTAFGVLRAAERLGIRVPEDLSVVGFDDVMASALTTPALTTIRQSLRDMGGAAVRMLLELILGRRPANPHPLFSTTLILRNSTAPPASGGS